MSPNDLTTLAAVREWWGMKPTQTDSDQLICNMITRMSSAILANLNRSTFLSTKYSDVYQGTGTSFLMLGTWPVTAISSVNSGGVIIPAQPAGNPNAAGYYFDQWNGQPAGKNQFLRLNGYRFVPGTQVAVSYTAGYLQQAEPGIVDPYLFRITPQNPWGNCTADAGVINAATGVALVAVKSAPTAGQYVPPQPLAGNAPAIPAINYYQFSAADANLAVLLNYSYTPSIIEQAVIEWCAERLEYKGRIGQTSQTLGGKETTAFNIAGVPPFVTAAIQNYKSVVSY